MKSPSEALYRGVLQALVYADIFDHPLTLWELHRYTVGVPASREDIANAVASGSPLAPFIEQRDGLITLRGRGYLVARRHRREAWAQHLWPKAIAYGRRMAALPFVRMVAVTGALAMNNVEPEDDIDYFIVTEPGRLWVCRALAILLVRWAARQGDVLCPNYFLSTAALFLREHNLFTAHEVVQMVPLTGHKVYWRLRRLNAWIARFLPNAVGPPRVVPDGAKVDPPWRRVAEWMLRSPVGALLEHWESERKVRRFTAQAKGCAEVYFSSHHCKGHFDQHGKRTLDTFYRRWRDIERSFVVQGEVWHAT